MIQRVLVLVLLLSNFYVKAQTYGVQVGAAYDSPLGSFAQRYRPVTAYHADFLWIPEESATTVNFTIGYNTFKPKEDIFYFLTKEGEDFGTIVYSDYELYTAYVGGMHNFTLTETLKFGLGFNFGAYFSHYTSGQSKGTISSNIGDTNVYLAAKTGFSYDVSDHIQFNLEAKYNGFSPTGKNDARTPAFNGHIGTVNYTWSSGVSVAYKF